jgi:hypothetical protein
MIIVMKTCKNICMGMLCIGVLTVASTAQTTTTTTTTTSNADGTTTTEEVTTTEGTSTNVEVITGGRNLVGPTGVTGTIRRADRRQDRRN